MCVWTRKYPAQKIFEIGRGGGYPHRPIFLTCMEPVRKSGAILMKFTQDACMDEKITWTKNFKNRSGGKGTPHRPTFHFSAFMNMKKRKGIDFGQKKKNSPKPFFYMFWRSQNTFQSILGGPLLICTLCPVSCTLYPVSKICPRDNSSKSWPILIKQKPKRSFWRGIGWYCKWSKSSSGFGLNHRKTLIMAAILCMAGMPSSWPIGVKFGMRVVFRQTTNYAK